MAADWSQYYEGAGKQFNVEPNLLRAIVQTESGGDPNAVSSAGAIGPAQILPETAASLGVADSKDPQQAIYGAAKLLDENLTRYKNTEDAVRAYHGGTDQANWGPKTQDYLQKVSKAYKQISAPQDVDYIAQLSGAAPAKAAPESQDVDYVGQLSKAAPVTAAPQSEQATAPTSGGGSPGLIVGASKLANSLLNPSPDFGRGLIHSPVIVGNTILNAADYLHQKISQIPGASQVLGAINPGVAGMNQLLPAAESAFGVTPQQRAADVAMTNQLHGSSPAFNAGQVVGATALTAPALAAAPEALGVVSPMAASLLGGTGNIVRGVPYVGPLVANALTGGAQGGAAAASTSGGSNEPLAQQVGTGAALGAALGPLAPLVQKIGAGVGALLKSSGATTNKLAAAIGAPSGWAGEAAPSAAVAIVPPEVENALLKTGVKVADLPPAVKYGIAAEAAAQSAANGAINPEALARKANLEGLGLKPTDAMVTRDPIQWAKEREDAKALDGSGAPLMTTFQNNNQALRDHLHDVGEQSGGATATPYDAGQSIIGATKAKLAEWQGDVSRAYEDVAQSIGDKAAITPARLQADLAPLSDATAGAPIVDAITKRLGRYGITKDPETGQWEGQISAANAEELRKFIANEGGNSADSQRIVRGLQQSLDNDVVDSTGSDSFAAARNLARQRFNEIDSSKVLSDIHAGTANPDNFLSRYVIGKSSTAEDLDALQKSLSGGNALQTQRGGQAWNDLKQQTADWIAQKATNGNPKEGMVSYPQLRGALNAIGPQKLQIIFGEDGANKYQSLLQATHDSAFQPGMSPVNSSNTANTLLSKATEKSVDMMKHVPGLEYPGLVISGITKAAKKAAAESEITNRVQNSLRGSAVPAGAAAAPVIATDNPLLNLSAIGAAANSANYLTQGGQQK